MKLLSEFIATDLKEFTVTVHPIPTRTDGMIDGDMLHYLVTITHPKGSPYSFNFSTGLGWIEQKKGTEYVRCHNGATIGQYRVTLEMIDGQPEWRLRKGQSVYDKRHPVARGFFGATLHTGTIRVSKPTAEDIWSSLLMDLDDSIGFNDFCDEFGYDNDSRKAENIWRATVDQARSVKRLLGPALIQQVDECEFDL